MNFTETFKTIRNFIVREQHNLIPALGVGLACFVLKKFGGKLKLGSDIKLSIDGNGIKITPGVSINGGHDFDIYRSRASRIADAGSFSSAIDLNICKNPANALESAIAAVYQNGVKATFDSGKEKAASKIAQMVREKDNISEQTKCAAIEAIKRLGNNMTFESGRQKVIDLVTDITG